jgi:hypothetical protein
MKFIYNSNYKILLCKAAYTSVNVFLHGAHRDVNSTHCDAINLGMFYVGPNLCYLYHAL